MTPGQRTAAGNHNVAFTRHHAAKKVADNTARLGMFCGMPWLCPTEAHKKGPGAVPGPYGCETSRDLGGRIQPRPRLGHAGTYRAGTHAQQRTDLSLRKPARGQQGELAKVLRQLRIDHPRDIFGGDWPMEIARTPSTKRSESKLICTASTGILRSVAGYSLVGPAMTIMRMSNVDANVGMHEMP